MAGWHAQRGGEAAAASARSGGSLSEGWCVAAACLLFVCWPQKEVCVVMWAAGVLPVKPASPPSARARPRAETQITVCQDLPALQTSLPPTAFLKTITFPHTTNTTHTLSQQKNRSQITNLRHFRACSSECSRQARPCIGLSIVICYAVMLSTRPIVAHRPHSHHLVPQNRLGSLSRRNAGFAGVAGAALLTISLAFSLGEQHRWHSVCEPAGTGRNACVGTALRSTPTEAQQQQQQNKRPGVVA